MSVRTAILVFCLLVILPMAGLTSPAWAQEMPSDYQEVLKVLGRPAQDALGAARRESLAGRQGDYQAGVLKVNIPRNDLKVTVAGVAMPTPFGFGGWVAMTKGDGGMDVMMGDLVLLQEEVNPVMSALLEHGLDVTALHNHFFWEEPRIFYMHIHGHGQAMDLARRVKPALDLIGKLAPNARTRQESSPKSDPPVGALDTAKITRIVGHAGEQTGPVYKITIGREDLKVREMGAIIDARMGLNTWAAFVGTNEDAAVAGDVAMLENEVTPVLKALRQHGLDVVAIHHHMTGERPLIIFLHYWGRGPVEKLATGFRAALDELGKRTAR